VDLTVSSSNCNNSVAPDSVNPSAIVCVGEQTLGEHARVIRVLGKQTIANIIEIGRRLVECRDNHLGRGEWLPWLKREFDWSRQTADRFIHVFEAADKLPKLGNLEVPISGLYLLTAPSVPEAVREEAIERAEAGEKMPLAEVKRIIEDAKGRAQSGRRTPNPSPNSDVSGSKEERIRHGLVQAHERNEDLQDALRALREDKRALEIKVLALEDEVAGLKRENASLKAALELVKTPPAAPDDGLDIPACLRRTAPESRAIPHGNRREMADRDGGKARASTRAHPEQAKHGD
jgi:Protein of unknown function (DUF3102)